MIAIDFQKELDELREEGLGNRGAYYEKFGSAITPALLPLADVFEVAYATHPDLAKAALAQLMP